MWRMYVACVYVLVCVTCVCVCVCVYVCVFVWVMCLSVRMYVCVFIYEYVTVCECNQLVARRAPSPNIERDAALLTQQCRQQ